MAKNYSISPILETNYQVSDSYFSYQESSSLKKDSDEEPAAGAILLMIDPGLLYSHLLL